ncbi:MAG: PEFG-CTERM sorting domain-containing protein [Thaumarchaeota archaeon]|nr:MAG: PEFG-CTERM sorting domain-containing protein [Nitrososphaerota archaeon]
MKIKFVMRYFVFPVIALFVLSIWYIPSFAQTAPNITTTTDRPSYIIGDTIVISGAVKAVVKGTPLTIQILDSNKNLVQIAQIDVSQDGKYADTLQAIGPLWKASGTYTVKVQYGPTVTAQTTFTFTSASTPTSNYFIVKDPSSQQTFSVNYTINGGIVKDMTIDPQSISLIVSLNSTSDGSIALLIPRSLIDAKTSNGQDDAFIILIDGAEVKPQGEETSNNFRTLTIQFLQGDQDVEIIGTQIVPEFGPIAALVLAIAIISIIVVSAKTGLRFMPKY